MTRIQRGYGKLSIRNGLIIPAALFSLVLASCRQDMHDQPKYKPLRASRFFADGRSARPLPMGVIARGHLDDTDSLHTGTANGAFLTQIPVPVNIETLSRGQERFNIYCAPCHGRVGDGRGMIARRGFMIPSDLNSPRVRHAPPGYIFGVITNGYGAMPDYRDQVPVADRWAIAAYVRALERSRQTTLADVPAEHRTELEAHP